MTDPELPVELMLDVLDASLRGLPEEAQPEARRATLAHFARLHRERGAPFPVWLRVGLEREESEGPDRL